MNNKEALLTHNISIFRGAHAHLSLEMKRTPSDTLLEHRDMFSPYQVSLRGVEEDPQTLEGHRAAEAAARSAVTEQREQV